MEEKIHVYENDEITVKYDLNRCIHATECVKGLRSVFDPDKRPWIQPGAEATDKIAEIVERCPTGALHYQRKDDGREESIPEKNTISVTPDGPVYLRGNIEVQDHKGDVLLTDTRFALCRCGKSANKPACDNTHTKINFEAPAFISTKGIEEGATPEQPEKLILKAMKNGPVLVEGSYTIYSPVSPPMQSAKKIALCRCGGSGNKPFCDGTHKQIGFEG